jgi:hypothetical protein
VKRQLWARWKRFAHRAAEIQSMIVLAILYWVVVVPVGLLKRSARRDAPVSFWKNRPPSAGVSVEDARRQY